MQLVPDPMATPIVVPPRPSYHAPNRRVWTRVLWPMLPGLLLLIALRVLWMGADPTDYPTDRNFSTLRRIQAFSAGESAETINVDYGDYSMNLRQLTPELPIIASGGWLLAHVTGDPVIAARIVSLGFSVAAGVGLYLLGMTLAGPLTGACALLCFALAPLSVFMGRAMLPDGPAMAFLIWALWAAVALDDRRPWRLGLWALLFSALAVLAKLPMALFMPLVWLTALVRLNPRRVKAWWILLITGVLLIGVTLLGYRVKPWALPAELAEMSKQTNDLLNWDALPQGSFVRMYPWRLVLAWTLPGAVLVVLGAAIGLARAGGRWLLGGWFLLSLFLSALSLRANGYWAYTALPVGALLAGLALASMWRSSRASLIILLLLLAPLAWIDPALTRLADFMTPQSKLRDNALAMRDRMPQPGSVLYVNQVPFLAEFYNGRAGRYPLSDVDARWRNEVSAGMYAYVNSTTRGGPLVQSLFDSHAIVHQNDGGVTFDGRPGIGSVLADGPLPTGWIVREADLAGQIRVLGCRATPGVLSRGMQLDVDLALERLPGLPEATRPRLSINLVHLATQEQIHYEADAGGGLIAPTRYPVVQMPDFVDARRMQVRSQYRISPHLPAGDYGLRLRLLDPPSSIQMADMLIDQPIFRIAVPGQNGPLPQSIALDGMQKFDALLLRRRSVLGAAHSTVRLAGEGHLRWRPNLPPGKYELRMLVEATPNGLGETDWPVFVVRQARLDSWRECIVHSIKPIWIRLPFEWRGDEDFLQCFVKNPASHWPGAPFPPLTYDNVDWFERSVTVHRVEVHPAS